MKRERLLWGEGLACAKALGSECGGTSDLFQGRPLLLAGSLSGHLDPNEQDAEMGGVRGKGRGHGSWPSDQKECAIFPRERQQKHSKPPSGWPPHIILSTMGCIAALWMRKGLREMRQLPRALTRMTE